MTSLGDKTSSRKDEVQLSAKMTAANSNQSHTSFLVAADLTNQKKKIMESVFQSEKEHCDNLGQSHKGQKESHHEMGANSAEQRSFRIRNSSNFKTVKPGKSNVLMAGPQSGKRLTLVNGQPESTSYKAQLEHLDNIAKKYQELIKVEEAIKAKADLLEEKKHEEKEWDIRHKTSMAQKINKSQLAEQIWVKQLNETTTKQLSKKQEVLINKMVEDDDTLMAVYPKIKGVPEFRKKEAYRRQLSKITKENFDQDAAQKDKSQKTRTQDRNEFTVEAERLLKLDEEEKELQRKDLLLRNLDVQRVQIQSILQKELQKKIREKADKLEHKILFTFPQERVHKKKSNQLRSSKGELERALRQAEIKAKLAQEALEAAEKPAGSNNIWATTDGGLWNKNLYSTKTPASSYGQQFQDPRKILEAQRELKIQAQVSMTDSAMVIQDKDFTSVESVSNSQEEYSENGEGQQRLDLSSAEINIETDGDDLVEHKYEPYTDLKQAFQQENTQRNHSLVTKERIDDDFRAKVHDKETGEGHESFVDRISLAAKSQAKLRSQVSVTSRQGKKFRRKMHIKVNKTVQQREESAFETKSMVSQRSIPTKEKQREDRSLHILTKRALNQIFDGKNDNYLPKEFKSQAGGRGGTQSIVVSTSNRNTDQISESSSHIKHSIKRSLYTAFPEMKDKQTMSKLGDMQAKAQLDALKRFIQSMEVEVIEKKRIAQEQREINHNFDGRIKLYQQKQKKKNQANDNDIKEQIKLKTKIQKDFERRNREIPDIEGNEGYPKIKQLSTDESRQKQIKENDFIAKALQQQMESKQARKKLIVEQEAEDDRQFVSGWGYRKDIQGQHYATSGNLGKVEGPSLQQHVKKETDIKQMKEVWQKAALVKNLKHALESKHQMTVNEDKLDLVLNSTKNRLLGIEQNPHFKLDLSSSHSLSLPNRNILAQQIQTMPPALFQNTSDYEDTTPSRNRVTKGEFTIFDHRSNSLGRRVQHTTTNFYSPSLQNSLLSDNVVLQKAANKRSESVQKQRPVDSVFLHKINISVANNTTTATPQDELKRRLGTTKSQPAHILSSGIVKPRQDLNTMTALDTKMQLSRQRQPLDSINILERIQSKIEEKLTRADTSQAQFATIPHRNHVAVKSASISSSRRCPNLQRMIDKKKEEEEGDSLAINNLSAVQMSSLRKSSQILKTIDNTLSKAQIRAKTGDFSDKMKNKSRSLYPWEQRLLEGNQKKKIKGN